MEFAEAFRFFSENTMFPKEGQRLDRLTDAFGEKYFRDHQASQELSRFKFKDKKEAQIVAYYSLILHGVTFNPSIKEKDKLSFQTFTTMMIEANDNRKIEEGFLKSLYNNLSQNEIKMKFIIPSPGYEVGTHLADNDVTYTGLKGILNSNENSVVDASTIFPKLAEVTGKFHLEVKKQKKGLLDTVKDWFGYCEGVISILDENNKQVASVQFEKPGWFSRSKPNISIRPSSDDFGHASQTNLEVAAALTASFSCPADSSQATWDYRVKELNQAYYRMTHSLGANVKAEIPQIPITPKR